MRSILIISPDAWSAHTVSKHHYATTLAALGHQVYFLNPPVESARRIEVTPVTSHPRLHVVSARKVASGLRFYPSFLRRHMERRWLEDLERAAGVEIDIIWLFENSRFFDLSFAGDRLKIYHQVDLNQTFNPEMAASTADICFCTTELIREKLLASNERVYKIHHGLAEVDKPKPLTPQQLETLDISGVTAVYIGNLDIEYLDVELIHDAAAAHKGITFHLVGSYRTDGPLYSRCQSMQNIRWWGQVESSVIPSILEKADVLLVAYRTKRWKDLASPHKFMEYLASGKIIVSTYTEEYKNRKHLLEMVDNSDDYLDTLTRVVDNLNAYNDEEKMKERRLFAQDHGYRQQVGRIDDLLRANNLTTLLPA